MNNIYKLIFAKFLGNLYFSIPIQTIFFFAKGLSFTEVMWLESILLVGIILFEVPTGILGDKIGRKWGLVLGSATATLAWIPWFLADGFWMFALAFFMSGIAIAFSSGSDQALIYDDLKSQGKEKKMQKIYGIYLAMFTLSSAVAGLVGGFIASSHNLEVFYFLYKMMVVTEILGLFVLLFVKDVRESKQGEQIKKKPETAFALFSDGIKLLRGNNKLKRIFLLSLFTTPFSITLIYIFQPYFLQSAVSTEWFGIAIFLSSLLAVSAKLLAHKIEAWFGITKGIMLVTILPALFWSLMGILFTPVIAVLLFILNDGAGNLRDPIFADFYNRHITSHNRATVLSTISLIVSIYVLLMRPTIGYLADINLSFAFFAMALIILFGALAFRLRDSDVGSIN
ncbi:MAG: MFS transporter [Candidatus Uhrbacteria bacterium]